MRKLPRSKGQAEVLIDGPVWDELCDLVEWAAGITVANGSGLDIQRQPGGPVIDVKMRTPAPFWAELTEEGEDDEIGWYSWKQVRPLQDGSGEWEDADPPVTGELNARDANETRGLTGDRVQLRKNGQDEEGNPSYLFTTDNQSLFEDDNLLIGRLSEIDVINFHPTDAGNRFDFGHRLNGIQEEEHVVAPEDMEDKTRWKLEWTGYDVTAHMGSPAAGSRLLYFYQPPGSASAEWNAYFHCTPGTHTANIKGKVDFRAYGCGYTQDEFPVVSDNPPIIGLFQGISSGIGIKSEVVEHETDDISVLRIAADFINGRHTEVAMSEDGDGDSPCALRIHHNYPGYTDEDYPGHTITFTVECDASAGATGSIVFDGLGHWTGTDDIEIKIKIPVTEIPANTFMTGGTWDPDLCTFTPTYYPTAIKVINCG